MADLYGVLRFVHVVAAAAWFGGSLLAATRLVPVMRAAGPAGGPFVLTLVRKGGMSPFFATAGLVTVLAGLYVYVAGGWMEAPFADASRGMLTVGVALGLLAFGHAMATSLPTERRMRAIVSGVEGQPSSEQVQKLAALGAKNGRNATIVAVLVGLTFVLMTGRHLVV